MHTLDDKPRHKPNTKHTLEEILKSLQDLIRNDLLETDVPPGAPPPAATADAVPSHAPEGDLAALRHSLEHLVSDELRPEDTADAPRETPELTEPPPASAAAAVPAPPGGLQQELLFEALAPADTGELPAGAAPAFPPLSEAPPSGEPVSEAPGSDLTTPDATAPETVLADSIDTAIEPAPEDSTDASAVTHAFAPEPVPAPEVPAPAPAPLAAAEPATPEDATVVAGAPVPDDGALRSAGDWDDIPVLEDVVVDELEPEPLPPAPAGPADRGAPAHAPAAVPAQVNLALPLPAPNRAHDLAVKTVAKLNIELRKTGKRPLDPKVITRLAMMLREALESDTANVDNKPQP
jgi:hypothetical protein